MAASGCLRECAEAQGKDVGVIATQERRPNSPENRLPCLTSDDHKLISFITSGMDGGRLQPLRVRQWRCQTGARKVAGHRLLGGAGPQVYRPLSDVSQLRLIPLHRVRYYISTAKHLQRTAPWLAELEGGIEYLKKVVLEDSLGICDDLEKMIERNRGNEKCEWKEVAYDEELRKKFKQPLGAHSLPVVCEFSLIEERTVIVI